MTTAIPEPGFDRAYTQLGELIGTPPKMPTRAMVDAWVAQYNATDTGYTALVRVYESNAFGVIVRGARNQVAYNFMINRTLLYSASQQPLDTDVEIAA